MAKGLDRHRARRDTMGFHGKNLARRAKRKCELCEEGGELHTFDTDSDVEPSLDTLVLLCNRCTGLAQGKKEDERTLRFLETTVWAELPVIAILARQVLARVDADWARGTLEMVG
jgi:protein PhnA